MLAYRLAFVLALAAGCGGAALATSGDAGPDATAGDGAPPDSTTPPDDGPSPDTGEPRDAGTFACGEASCMAAGQICVHPGCGCIVAVFPPNDAGMCADGSRFVGSLDGCVPIPHCDPYCWSPNGNSLNCTGQDGSVYGVVNTLPDGTDLVCYDPCA